MFLWLVRTLCIAVCCAAALVASITGIFMTDATAPLLASHTVTVQRDTTGPGDNPSDLITHAATTANVDLVRIDSLPVNPARPNNIYYSAGRTTPAAVTAQFTPLSATVSAQFFDLRTADDLGVTGTYYLNGNQDAVDTFTVLLNDSNVRARSEPLAAAWLRPFQLAPVVGGTVVALTLLAAISRAAYLLMYRRSLAAYVLLGWSRQRILATQLLGDLLLSVGLSVLLVGVAAGYCATNHPAAAAAMLTTIALHFAGCLLGYFLIVVGCMITVLNQPILPGLKGAALPVGLIPATLVAQMVVALVAVIGLLGLQHITTHNQMHRESLRYWQQAPQITTVDGFSPRTVDDSDSEPVGEMTVSAEEKRQEVAVGEWVKAQDQAGNFVLAAQHNAADTADTQTLNQLPGTTYVHINRNYLRHFVVRSTSGQIAPDTNSQNAILVIPPHLSDPKSRTQLTKYFAELIADEASIADAPAPALTVMTAPSEQTLFLARSGSLTNAHPDLAMNPIVLINPDVSVPFTPIANYLAYGTGAGGFFVDPVEMRSSAQAVGVAEFLGSPIRLFSTVAHEYRLRTIVDSTIKIQVVAAGVLLIGMALALGWLAACRRQQLLFVYRMHGSSWFGLLKQQFGFAVLPALVVLGTGFVVAVRDDAGRLTVQWSVLTSIGLFAAILWGVGCAAHWWYSQKMVQHQLRQHS